MKSTVLAVFLALSVGSVFAQSGERVLVPFYTETPIEGSYGSRWTTELAVLNKADEPIDIGGYFQGCQFSRSASDGVVKPQCPVPAPLGGIETRPSIEDPDRYIVVLEDGVNVEQETARLAQKFGFAVSSVFTILPGFSAVMWSDAVALVRCEPSVKSVVFSATNIPPP